MWLLCNVPSLRTFVTSYRWKAVIRKMITVRKRKNSFNLKHLFAITFRYVKITRQCSTIYKILLNLYYYHLDWLIQFWLHQHKIKSGQHKTREKIEPPMYTLRYLKGYPWFMLTYLQNVSVCTVRKKMIVYKHRTQFFYSRFLIINHKTV